jgi:hypothetical protein
MIYGNPHLDKHLITNTARTMDSLIISASQRLYLYRGDPLSEPCINHAVALCTGLPLTPYSSSLFHEAQYRAAYL